MAKLNCHTVICKTIRGKVFLISAKFWEKARGKE